MSTALSERSSLPNLGPRFRGDERSKIILNQSVISFSLIGTTLGLAVALALASAPSLGLAQSIRRSPQAREALVQLAYDLGEAHALHRLCAGPSDATWYARMQQLQAQEAADESFRRRLVQSFNGGFSAGSSEYTACTPKARAAERAITARGAALAQQLAADGG